jgi:hypothetical protein
VGNLVLARKHIGIVVMLFLLLVPLVIVLQPSLVYGQQGEQNMKINLQVLTGQGLDANYVGDYFWYDITLENNGTTTIAATFTVNVYNTTHGLLYPVGDFVRSLNPGETTHLYPNYTREGRQEYSIFFFDSPGTYELAVSSSVPIAFYQYFPAGNYIVQHSTSRFYFDALPASEKALNERMNRWIQENEQWVAQSRESTLEEMKSTRVMLQLTTVMFLVTVINAFLVVWSTRMQVKKRASLLLYVYLAIMISILILVMLGVPISFLGG